MKKKYILPPSLDHEVLGYYRPKSLLKLSRKLWLYISKTPKSLKKKNAFEAKGHQYTKDKVIQRSFNIDLYTYLAMYRYR